jgi:tetratricopeptide (TPR) repeat protein
LPDILGSLAYGYHIAGFPDKARYYSLEKLKLDGDSVSYFSILGLFEMYAQNFEKAKELFKKCIRIDSGNVYHLRELGASYMYNGEYKEAFKYYYRFTTGLEALGKFTLNNTHRIGFVYMKNGYTKEAKSYFDKQIAYCQNIIKSGRQSPFTNYDLAGVYAFMGDKSKAYENLRIFNNAERFPLWMASLIKYDPLFDSIRNEPEFQKIARDVEAKYQAEHERVRKWLTEQGML